MVAYVPQQILAKRRVAVKTARAAIVDVRGSRE
jgi:hypothetical protein